MKQFFQIILLSFLVFVLAMPLNAQVKLIFDTDFGGDADDLGALAMLNHFQNKNEIELMAVMCWNLEKYAISAIDAVNTFYGNPDIPLGLRAGDNYFIDWNHSKPIADKLDHDITPENAQEATKLYRKLLAESDDKSVVIVTVGPLANIQNLMNSQPDEFSNLNGIDLIHKKVKEFVVMGGQFPSGSSEWNFNGNMLHVTSFVLERVLCPVVFLGYELGVAVKSGEVFNSLPHDHPLHIGFMHFSKNAPWMNKNFKGKILDNSTFDQTAVLYAVRNGIGTYWTKIEGGFCNADEKGGNVWVEEEKSRLNHCYLVLKMDAEKIATEFEKFMLGNF